MPAPTGNERAGWRLNAEAARGMKAMAERSARRPTGRLMLAGGVLGFALGGFFDGILLHQVLQWHHFLSLVPGEALRDIRVQILWDGLFHVAVYGVAALGLALLWRARGDLAGSGADRRLLAAVLLGFAVWQAADVVLFHWVVGIHRIRVDVPNPLAWDVGWLVATGLPPLLLAWRMLGRASGGSGGQPGSGHGGAVAAMLAITVLAAGPVAARPPAGVTTALVLFRPGLGPEAALAAVAAADGRMIWADERGEFAAVDLGESGSAWRLYRHGALLVGSSPVVGGCLGWSRSAG
jgi:uncharacterized membrane protein